MIKLVTALMSKTERVASRKKDIITKYQKETHFYAIDATKRAEPVKRVPNTERKETFYPKHLGPLLAPIEG